MNMFPNPGSDGPTPPGHGPAPGLPPRVKIMLVDDNAILAEALPFVLRNDHRFEWTGWVESGRDVLTAVTRVRPHVVLMDVDMPNVDTFELVREVTRCCPDTKVVMFSGHVRQEYIEAAFDAGAFGYLHKDDEFPALLESLLKAHAGEIVMSTPIRQMIWRQ
jgi:DNA-binding NarL/FixJ family response regulator